MIAPSKSTKLMGVLRHLSPNAWIATLISFAMGIELLLVSFGSHSLSTTDWPTRVFALSYLIWFWTTTGWCVYFLANRWRDAQGKSLAPRVLLSMAIVLFLVNGVLLYAISWGLFLKVGRFANLESVRFVLFNVDHLYDYLVAAESMQIIVGILVVVLAAIGIPLLLNKSGKSTWAERPLGVRQLSTWVALSLLAMICWQSIPGEASTLRRANRRRALSFETHPTFSLMISYWESNNEAKIIPCLDEKQLVRLPSPTERSAISEEWKSQKLKKRSVIVVAIESLRHDTIHFQHQGQEVLPNINKLAKRGVEFTRAYAQSTHSDYADVCLLSSLYPLRTPQHHYYSRSDPWPKTLAYDLLKPLGYSTAIISSQNEMWGGMAHFLDSPNLDLFYHPETAKDKDQAQAASARDPGFSRELNLGTLTAGKFPDQHTTSKAIEWIKSQASENHLYFLSMNLQSSHFPYLMPDSCERPFQPCELGPNTSFVSYPVEETPVVRNAYFNAIRECDRQIGRLVQTLESLGQLDDTILIVTGENGESFHECGGSVAHAREPVEPAVHIAMVLHSPSLLQPSVEAYPFEHVDLVPTLFGLLGLPTHPNFQGIDVLADDRPNVDDRLNFCHVNSSLAACDAITLGGRWKLTIDRVSGHATLFDTQSDPNEERDLSKLEPEKFDQLQAALDRWRENQFAYYHLHQYYLNFYPPKPPIWKYFGDEFDAKRIY